MIKYYICFFVLLFSVSLIAQNKDYSVSVVNEKGEPVISVHAICERTQTSFITDEHGVLKFNTEQLRSTDTLVFQSIFYEQRHFVVSELIINNQIVLPSSSVDLEGVTIYPKEYVFALVKKLSDFFSKNYSRDYISTMTYTKTIECNGKYREFFGFKGLLPSLDFNQKTVDMNFEDKNFLIRWIPLTVMRSDPFASTGNSILEVSCINLTFRTSSKEELLIQYQDIVGVQNILNLKRSIEIYSPLNPKQIKYFEYKIHKILDNGRVTVIHFKTKENVFFNKTRIYGEGYLYYCNNTGLVEKVIMENQQDQFVAFPRKKSLKPGSPSATQHNLEVNYKLINNKIYADKALFNVKWVDPMCDSPIYYIRINSRRNPIKYQLKESEYVQFSDFVDLDKTKKQIIENKVYGTGMHAFYSPFIESEWNKSSFTWLDWNRLETELNINNKTLTQQAKDNANNIEFYLSHMSSSESLEIIKSYLRNIGGVIYPLVYNKKYEPQK